MRLHKAPRKQKDDFLQGFCTYTRVAKKQPKEVEEVSPAPVKKPGRKKRAPTSNVVPTDKDSIMSKN